MPFPIEEKYIIETESKLNVLFPKKFKSKMIKMNGGHLELGKYEFELYPFFDKSNRKRISRTCNHIELETKNSQKWSGFPKHSIAIGSDDFGNKLILKHKGDGFLNEELYFWNHETRNSKKIANSIDNLNKENDMNTKSFWTYFKGFFKK